MTMVQSLTGCLQTLHQKGQLSHYFNWTVDLTGKSRFDFWHRTSSVSSPKRPNWT